MQTSKVSSNSKTKDLVQTALLTALIFVSTYWIQFQLPFGGNGGLVHLGTAMLFISAIVFGKNKGAISAAIGMGLFDLVSGWGLWAPFTFVIKGSMAYLVGLIVYSKGREGNNVIVNIIATFIAGVWMIAGYFLTNTFLSGNWATAVASIPGDITQIALGMIVGIPIAKVLKKFKI